MDYENKLNTVFEMITPLETPLLPRRIALSRATRPTPAPAARPTRKTMSAPSATRLKCAAPSTPPAPKTATPATRCVLFATRWYRRARPSRRRATITTATPAPTAAIRAQQQIRSAHFSRLHSTALRASLINFSAEYNCSITRHKPKRRGKCPGALPNKQKFVRHLTSL